MDFSLILVVFTQVLLTGSFPVDLNQQDIHTEYLYGRSRDEYMYVINHLTQLRQLSWKKHGITPKHTIYEDDAKGLMDDIILAREDIEVWLNDSSIDHIFKRIKRNIVNFEEHPDKKWTFPIAYAVETATIADEVHQAMIKQALDEWEEKTCVTFQKLESVEGVEQQYLYFHGDTDRCSSYIGRQNVDALFPQYVNMNPTCFSLIGTAIHEIGHALGLHHEHQRPDRDDYVAIIWDNIQEGQEFNFEKETTPDVTLSGNPYGYSSVMHYGGLHFSVDEAAAKYTIVPKNSDFLTVIGQQSQLTFYDAKVVNTAYCSDRCSNQLSCQNGGYQDPNNCNQCRCPDQWAGTLCEESNTGSTGCSPFTGSREHSSEDSGFTFYLYSPTSDEFGHFIPGESCFWTVKVPENMFIKFWFGEDFGLLLTTNGICLFWVEIRNPSDTQARRYCGHYDGRPPFVHYSQANEAVVLFQSFAGVTSTPFQDRSYNTLGFKLFYKFSTCASEDCEQTQCSCQQFLDDNQQTHEELCVTKSWCRNNGYPDPDNCDRCICQEGWTGTYCTEITDNPCTNQDQCYNGGQPDPNDCNQCICPEEWSGPNCWSVAAGSDDCSQKSGSYVAETIGTLYSLSEGSFTPGKQCYWHMRGPDNTYLEFTLARQLGLHKSTEGDCIFWLEIFDVSLDVDTNGRRFCGFQGSTAPVKFQSENNVAFIVFKSFTGTEFPTDSTSNFGFTLYFEAVNKSSTTNTAQPTTPSTTTAELSSTTSSTTTSKKPVEVTDTKVTTTVTKESERTVTSSTTKVPDKTESIVASSTTKVSEKTASTVTSSTTKVPEKTESIQSSTSTVGSQQTKPPVIFTSGVAHLVPGYAALLMSTVICIVLKHKL